MKSDNSKLKTGFKLLFFVFTFLFLTFNSVAATLAQATGENPSSGSGRVIGGTPSPIKLAPDCNPTLSPIPTPEQIKEAETKGKSTQPCNITAFIKWIKQLINVLLTIAIPIGVIFVVWGAFVIITAGGSEDRVRKGKDVITAAVIGIAIAFGAWLIITTVNKILTGGF